MCFDHVVKVPGHGARVLSLPEAVLQSFAHRDLALSALGAHAQLAGNQIQPDPVVGGALLLSSAADSGAFKERSAERCSACGTTCSWFALQPNPPMRAEDECGTDNPAKPC